MFLHSTKIKELQSGIAESGKAINLVGIAQRGFLNAEEERCFRKATTIPVKSVLISSKHRQEDFPSKTENQFAKLALVALAAGVLTLGSVDTASAAKTGGRVGGQAFRPSAPRSSGPRINNSRTNVYINPPIAPPLVGGYGYGFGVPFYGGWVSAVVRRFRGSRDEDDDDEY
ncbi:unnamed protein product [Fraxinus pennsylvanica]|uniref:Uncharacterized protein n=1 Tax=Fraxinus pennsylvanica TaxID=56036 RepID=A0AAD2A7L0_9LAMI|nr:unnamed protein product [Fraxinus pennsylvanica]